MQINNFHHNIASSKIANKEDLSSTKEQKAEKAAKEFESFFVYSMLQQTQPKIDTDNQFYGGTTEQAFKPLLNQYLADEIVEAGGIGLKENIIKQMNKYEEVQNYAR